MFVLAVRVCGMNERMGVGVIFVRMGVGVVGVSAFRFLRFPGSQGA